MDTLTDERIAMARERQSLRAEFQRLTTERNKLRAERDALRQCCQDALADYDILTKSMSDYDRKRRAALRAALNSQPATPAASEGSAL